MKVCITRPAEQDLENGHAFYERQAVGVGDYFLDSLFADIDSLVWFGDIHPKPNGYFRRALAVRCGRFEFSA